MSSVIAFVRALVMVACLVAVPVLAISQGSTISRGLQAAARFLDRISADSSQSELDDSLLADRALRSARPMPSPAASPSQLAASIGPVPPVPLPEPVEDRERTGPASPPTPQLAGPEPTAAEPRGPAVERHAPASPANPQVANWEQLASALQELGALEYALEKWGDSEQLYRFRCLATVPGTTSYQRHFHAVDADGGLAVERVVEQVRAWRANAARSD